MRFINSFVKKRGYTRIGIYNKVSEWLGPIDQPAVVDVVKTINFNIFLTHSLFLSLINEEKKILYENLSAY